MKKLRVVHWGTGQVGREALRGVLTHPQLELVGHYVVSPQKLGKDSGELCGLAPCGITTTNDLDALLALDADCLVYCGDGTTPQSIQAGCEVVARFLERGTNVVTPALLTFLYEPAARPELLAIVNAACRKGDSSLFTSGSDPGFGTTGFALGALSVVSEVNEVWVRELADYSYYPYVDALVNLFGFGQPMSFMKEKFTGDWMMEWWKGSVAVLADAIGVKVEEYRPYYEPASHDKDIDTGWLKIPAGSIAACRYGIAGIVDGKAVVGWEHITRMHADVAPHWMSPPGLNGKPPRHQYRCDIKGRPNLSAAFDMNAAEDGYDDGLIIAAMHLVNAIPAVCAAKPGLVNPLELPVFTTRNFRA